MVAIVRLFVPCYLLVIAKVIVSVASKCVHEIYSTSIGLDYVCMLEGAAGRCVLGIPNCEKDGFPIEYFFT